MFFIVRMMKKPQNDAGKSRSILSHTRKHLGSRLVEGFFEGVSRAGRLHPKARLESHGVERIPDIPYLQSGLGAHLLDVYRPAERSGPLPVCLYVHGGGFRILSKETHWLMGLIFARRGYVVLNINYRLAPESPFPSALEDTCDAFQWVKENAAGYGGDTGRMVLAGESAGANLITALTIALCYRRSEPYARKVWDLGLVPRAVVPACGMFQVSDVERFRKNGKLSWFINDRLKEVSRAYLAGIESMSAPERELADPLLVFEQGLKPERKLPAFFVPVGTGDILLQDTQRLGAAFQGLGVDHATRYYPREPHAFHAFIWRKNALACWKETFDFLSARLRQDIRDPSENRHTA